MAAKIGDVMTPAPYTILQSTPLVVAHRMMNEHRVRHLPVVESGKLVGMLSQRDLYFLETIQGVKIEMDRVEEAMTTDAWAVKPDQSVLDVMRTMARKRYGCAVVIDKSKVVGIFTTTDALRLCAGALAPPRRSAAHARAS